MFETYLEDAYFFLEAARKSSKDEEARRYYRVSIFCAWSGIEAFLNYVAETLASGKILHLHEIAFLSDKRYGFKLNKGMELQRSFHGTDDKLGFLINKFLPSFDFGKEADWQYVQELKELRNSLIHPRSEEDETPWADYDKQVKNGMKALIRIVNLLSTVLFKSPLRQKILDLMPEDP